MLQKGKFQRLEKFSQNYNNFLKIPQGIGIYFLKIMLYWQYIFAQAPFPILICSYWVLDYWITTMLEYWHLMNFYLHISDSIDLKLTQKY